MINVAFVCLGNICRSPMAELIFKDMVKERELALSFNITSFGTSDCEEGSQIYPPTKHTLNMHAISGSHIAKQISLKDIINNDYILVMDSSNLFDLLRLTGGEFGDKIYKLCSFTDNPRDVADPWYTRDFEKAFSDISDGCRAFLDYLLKEKAEAFDYDKRH
ncbi:MAG: low molecular weight phosphotyrosine protein phosphatase [Clostridia bacterium]|nr:low molecular weight phosphotyrosine protein phosphatase [Clostridia bacterium]